MTKPLPLEKLRFRKRPLDREEKARARILSDLGNSPWVIARILGRSYGTIRAFLKQDSLGIDSVSHDVQSPTQEEIYQRKKELRIKKGDWIEPLSSWQSL